MLARHLHWRARVSFWRCWGDRATLSTQSPAPNYLRSMNMLKGSRLVSPCEEGGLVKGSVRSPRSSPGGGVVQLTSSSLPAGTNQSIISMLVRGHQMGPVPPCQSCCVSAMAGTCLLTQGKETLCWFPRATALWEDSYASEDSTWT